MQNSKFVMLGGIVGVMTLCTLAHAQAPARTSRAGDTGSDIVSAAGCSRPEEAREAKIVEFDTGKSLAKLAVNLGSSRFKLVRITIWDRPEDPRPLVPVIEAARITQGLVQFYTPDLTPDPESTHDKFLLMVDMGGGVVCWATPASLIKDAGQSAAEAKPPSGRGADSVARSAPETRPESPAPAARSQTDGVPAAEAVRRSRTRPQITPAQ